MIAFLDDARAARGGGPVGHSWPALWPAGLRRELPGVRRVEAWEGNGAAFARFTSPSGPLFLKYLPLGWRDARAYRRFGREIAYLRDLAPLCPVRHAPLLHAAQEEGRLRSHLLTPDLLPETHGWGAFQTEAQRGAALLDVVRVMAQLHAFWANHTALTGAWAWQPNVLVKQAEQMTLKATGPHIPIMQDVTAVLPELLGRTPISTIAHGDIHSGQLLWPVAGGLPFLIDYGQVHTSIPGEDLAHLLHVRLNASERTQWGDTLREAYREEAAAHGLSLSPARLRHEEHAGLALNVLGTLKTAARSPGSGVQGAVQNVLASWAEWLA
ncbi:phosphotransferase family protein [Deinococcus fonticola]|uniref:phosphotransferase family protein n=1 Tax=Deinococcus fonticola TaxID=2528713 RepID=UPI001F0F45E1|nr:phosphotransferase [Deinococcus fonticola]